MDSSIDQDPLARALLRHLAETRGKEDPLGSFARTVLNGEAGLRQAAEFGWHSEGLAVATENGLAQWSKLPAEQRHDFESEAVRYREQLENAHGREAGDNR